MEDLTHLLAVLLPVFLLIVLGFGLSRGGFPGRSFWQPAEKLTYYILMPALLVQAIASPNPGGDNGETFALLSAMVASLLLLSAFLLVLRPLLFNSGPVFTSVYQGSIRFNSYIGISIVLFLFGDQGVIIAALLLALLIPLVNVICITLLLRFGRRPGAADGHGPTGRDPGHAPSPGPNHRQALVRAVLTNPVVLACLLGLLLHHGEMPLPSALDRLLATLGQAALPLGLLAVGASLEPAVLKQNRRGLLVATTLKLLGYPLLVWLFCLLLAVPIPATQVAVIFAALPGSALSTILARQLGGDTALISGITTAQTLAAALTLPLVLYLVL